YIFSPVWVRGMILPLLDSYHLLAALGYQKGIQGNKVRAVYLHRTPELQIGKQLTMMAWFFAKDISTWRQLIAKSDEYLLRIDPPQEGNKMSAFVKAQGNWEPRASAFVPKKEEWIHFAATYNADEKSNQLKVYVNGVFSGSSTRPGKVAPTTNPVEIGRWGGGSYFVGIIDEAAIFNVALTDKDIQTVMESGLQKIISGQLAVEPSGKLTTLWGEIKG
ncbi:LamG domain-containing protein, partial [Candidatus Poribacteria bacterium]|nr:LamG domain-containing protein [Candidatus Poribacteria bacterium]